MLVTIGLALLCYSLFPASKICQIANVNLNAWKGLLVLIIFFVFGYLLFIGHLLSSSPLSMIELVGSIIFVAGAVFVVLVIKLSLNSITHLNDSAVKYLYHSNHDSLTGLTNRHYFTRRINAIDPDAARQNYSVLLMDLDKFKLVNDLLGHQVGDLLLIETANRLSLLNNQNSVLCRIGGDEFAIIFAGNSIAQLSELAESIVDDVSQSFEIEGRNINVSISIGIARYPQDGTDGDQLLKHANISMYHAKNSEAGYAFYNAGFERELEQVSGRVKALQEAILQRKLFLCYQPIIDSKTGEVCAVEALSRWTLEDGTQISPGEFIAMAQANNLMHEITAIVLERSLQQLHDWHKKQLFIHLHVNLSATDFQDSNLVEKLTRLTDKYQIDPSYLTLEITESTLLDDFSITNQNIKLLRQQGISIAIDDFGMAFASLNYLRLLDINHLKLDYDFINKILTQEKDLAIIKFSIALAQALDCQVTAEGVESKELRDRLVSLGCDQLQGHWLCEPLPATEMTDWLLGKIQRAKTLE